jgi:hypothetical protein
VKTSARENGQLDLRALEIVSNAHLRPRSLLPSLMMKNNQFFSSSWSDPCFLPGLFLKSSGRPVPSGVWHHQVKQEPEQAGFFRDAGVAADPEPQAKAKP